MRGTPSYRGSLSGLTLEGSHSIVTSFSITDSSQNELFTVQPTSVTCSVDFNELSPSVCNYLKNVTSDVQDQIDACLRPREGVLQLTEDITLTGSYTQNGTTKSYTFAGVTPSEFHCL